MADGMAIKLAELLDVSGINNPDYQKVLTYIEQLNANMDKFIKTAASTPLKQLAEQQRDLAEAMQKVAESSSKENQVTEAGVKAITSALSLMQRYKAEIDGIILSKVDLIKAEVETETQLKAVTKIMKDSIAEMEKLKIKGLEQSSMYENLNKRVVESAIRIEELNDILKSQTEQIKLSSDSTKALQTILKDLNDQYTSLSAAEKTNVEIGGKMLSQIQELNTLLGDEKKQNL